MVGLTSKQLAHQAFLYPLLEWMASLAVLRVFSAAYVPAFDIAWLDVFHPVNALRGLGTFMPSVFDEFG